MSKSSAVNRVSEREHERQQLIAGLVADKGVAWAEEYRPGSFGAHELLDRTALLVDVLEKFVLTHPACVQNEEWYGLADQAFSALFDLYQQVGAAHLAEPS